MARFADFCKCAEFLDFCSCKWLVMTADLSFWAECVSTKRKIHAFKAKTHTLNLWILRCAQYDKENEYSVTLGMTKGKINQQDKTSRYDNFTSMTRTLSVWQNGRSVRQDKSVWQIYHYNTLSFAQHNNTFSKSLNLSLIAKNKRLLLIIASRLNGKAKHEKALKNDIWISIFDRKRFKVPKNAKSHYTT